MQQRKPGVCKARGSYYQDQLKRLELVYKERLLRLAELEIARETLEVREHVLVDLVLQQENHLQHLTRARSPLDSSIAELIQLLNIPENSATVSGSVPKPLANIFTGSSASTSELHTSAVDALPRTLEAGGSSVSSKGGVITQQQLQQQRQQDGSSSSSHSNASSSSYTELLLLETAAPAINPNGITTPSNSTLDPSNLCGGSSSGSSSNSGDGKAQYVQQLLLDATPEDWDRVFSMSDVDWCDYHNRLVKRLIVLAERIEASGSTSPSAATPAAAAGSAAAGAAAAEASESLIALPAAERLLLITGLYGAVVPTIDPMLELRALVDDFCTICNLCLLHNPMPMRECARRNVVTLEYQDVVPLSFWQEVNSVLDLSKEQVQQLQYGYSEYWRMLGQVHSQQQQLANSIKSSTTESTLAVPGMPQGRSSIDTLAAAAAAATAAAQERDYLLELLDKHMAKWQTAAQLLLQFYCNTLTNAQIAKMMIACYPIFPRMGGLVGALAEPSDPVASQQYRTQQQQQQHLAQKLRLQHMQQASRRKAQLQQQHQDYWRRLVVLRQSQYQQQLQQQQCKQQQQQQVHVQMAQHGAPVPLNHFVLQM